MTDEGNEGDEGSEGDEGNGGDEGNTKKGKKTHKYFTFIGK